MEREFVTPIELEQVFKNKLREELREIISDEENANSREQIFVQLNFKIFQADNFIEWHFYSDL